MSRQLITIYTNEDQEKLTRLLNVFFKKNNYRTCSINGENAIKKKAFLNFLNAHYIKIYFGSGCLYVEGWFTVSGKDYGLDDGIMYSEKHRALSQTIEALVSMLNSRGMRVENGTCQGAKNVFGEIYNPK